MFSPQPRYRRRSGQANTWQVAGLGVGLLALGFFSGYGYRSPSSSNTVQKPPAELEAPLVKGMRASPDGRLVAFTAIYANSEHSSVFLFDTKTGKWTQKESPTGWEDTVTQWSADGKKILFTREKIPRFAADADAGMYSAEAGPTDKQPRFDELQQLSRDKTDVPGERLVGGFWTPTGDLIVKARKEPKALYQVHDGSLLKLDQANVTYGQHRAKRVGKDLSLLVVRDVPGQPNSLALFRVTGGKSQQLTGPLSDVIWTYVCEDCNQMIVAKRNEVGEGWVWDLYQIEAKGARVVKRGAISPEVIKVFWSPDGKYVLGTGEEQVWMIELPGLKAKPVGTKKDWKVDDACWLGNTGSVVAAADGVLWNINVKTGESKEIWKFPAEFWDPKSAS